MGRKIIISEVDDSEQVQVFIGAIILIAIILYCVL